MEWQDISTAPRDGTEIVGLWKNAKGFWCSNPVIYHFYEGGAEGFITNTGWDEAEECFWGAPVQYWMPLPPPPTE